MKREKWKPSKEDVICMSHFKESDYDISPWSSKKTLRKEAIPSRFEFLEHLQKQPKSIDLYRRKEAVLKLIWILSP